MIEVLLIGTFHMNNPGLDIANAEIDDVLSEARQNEIKAVVENLARFRPTVVAVEWPCQRQTDLDAAFARFLDGRPADRSEIEQLGFQVASRTGLDGLVAVDVMDDFWVPGIDELAQQDGDAARRLEELMSLANHEVSLAQNAFRTSSIAELLLHENKPESRQRALAPYLNTILRIASTGEYPGPEAVANWYRRNFKIAANLLAAVSPGDRVLVIYGSGHIPVIEHALSLNEDIVFVEAESYLQATAS
jgi:hypothetical protein